MCLYSVINVKTGVKTVMSAHRRSPRSHSGSAEPFILMYICCTTPIMDAKLIFGKTFQPVHRGSRTTSQKNDLRIRARPATYLFIFMFVYLKNLVDIVFFPNGP